VKNKSLQKNLISYSFILPSLIGFLVFMVYPIVYSLVISLMDWNMFKGLPGSKFVGLKNYFSVFKNEYFIEGFKNNIKFTFMAIPLLLVVSLLLAVLLNRKVFARGFTRMLYFAPYIATITAAAVVFSVLFHPVFGPINGVLRSMGIDNPPQWIGSIKYALFTVALFWVWKNLGYCIVIYLAAMQSIPKSYYEAARIDGANSISQFLHITLPLISPTTFFLLVTNVILSLQIFPEMKVMTNGGPGTSTMSIVFHIYRTGFENFKMGYASAVTWVFFLIVISVTIVQWIGQKKWVKY